MAQKLYEKKTNISFLLLRFEKIIKTAGLENLSNRFIMKSLHQSPHLADILRLAVAYNFGGSYGGPSYGGV